MPRRKRPAAAARRPLSAGAPIFVYVRDSGGARITIHADNRFELQFHPPAAVLQVYGEVPPRGCRLITCLTAPY